MEITSRFVWTISNFSRLNLEKHYSEVFTVGGYKWRVLVYPKGNNVDHLSVYLDVADSGSLPSAWSRHAQFSLSIVNQMHSLNTVRNDTEHQFSAQESDWGFTSFMPLSDLYAPSGGYLVNDTCVIEAEVTARKVVDYWKYDTNLYTIIKVARDGDLAEQIGRDVYFDLVDHDKVHRFCIQKQMPFSQFKEEVAKEFGIPVQFQRFWLWFRRQNDTYRPHGPLTPQEEAQSLREVSNKAELRLFLEVELGQDLCPLPPPDKTKEDILLFFKLYDPEKEELRYVGRLFVRRLGKPADILTKLNEMAGFPPNEEIELYEEIKFKPSVMCIHVDKKLTFQSSELEDGDIICYQKSAPLESDHQNRYPDVPSFLGNVHNRQMSLTLRLPPMPPHQIIRSNGDQSQNHRNHNHHNQQMELGLAHHARAQNSVVMRGTELPSNIEATSTEIDAIISAIVGLDGVKLQLRKWIKGLVLYHKRKDLGLKVGTRKALHMAFLGNPGTGKTMVVRLLAKVLYKLGLASTDKVTEVQRTDLVAEYIGQTGVKTRLKIKEASGGILFVDEAYRLVPPNMPKDFGVEALEEIMSAMDNGDIIAIFAGYSEEMKRVISANAGFSRRVSKFFYFDDYTPADIANILHSKVNTQNEDTFIYGFKLHPDCTVKAIASLINEHITDEQLKKLNGGLVDPLLINSLENLDFRLDVNCMDVDTLTTITMKDLEEGLKSFSKSKENGP